MTGVISEEANVGNTSLEVSVENHTYGTSVSTSGKPVEGVCLLPVDYQ